MQKRIRNNKDQMYAMIRKWEASGLSQTEFFRQNEIPKSTFGYWRKKYLKETINSKKKEHFIAVKISKAGRTDNSQGVLELVYPNGVRLVCSANMELSRLKPLIIL